MLCHRGNIRSVQMRSLWSDTYLRNNGCLNCSWCDMNVYTDSVNIIGVCPKMLITEIDHSFYGQNLSVINKHKVHVLCGLPGNKYKLSVR